MRKIILSFILLSFSLLTFSQQKNELEELEIAIRNNPDKILEQLNSEELNHLSSLQKKYLYLIAQHQFGQYALVDSIINSAVNSNLFESDSLLLMKYLFIWSDMQRITDQFEKAIATNRRIGNYFYRNNDVIRYAQNNVALAEIYRTTENFEFGLSLLNESFLKIELNNSIQAERLRAKIYSRKAAIYAEKEQYPDSVMKYAILAIEIGVKMNNLNLLATCYNELGYLHINIDPVDPNPIAKQYFNKAITIWDSIGFSINSLYAKLNLSRYYNRKKEYKKGVDLLIKELTTMDSSKLIWEKGAYYEMLGRLYGGLGEFEQSYFYADLSKELLLSAQKTKYNEHLAFSDMQFELKRKELELQNQQIEINQFLFESDSKKKENTLLYASLISLLVIGVIISLFWLNSNKQRNKLRKQQTQIIEMNDELTDVIGEKESLLKEVNHRVKNNLSILSSLLYLQQKKMENPEVKSAIKDSLLRINTISLVHESLYQRDDMSHVDFQEYLNKLINYNKSIYWGNRPLELTIDCDGLAPELSTSVPLAMIINEMVTNSFKYAFENVASPKIRVIYVGGSLKYSDNGPGKKNDENKDSLGLKLISIFSRQIHANITTNTDKFGFHHIIKLKED